MTDTFADLLREVGISDDPARRSSVQLASELPRPRRPMPRQMRPQAGPTRAQTTYGGQQGDVSRMHGFHVDEARDRWLRGSTFADRLRGGATLAAETLGLPSVMAEAEALGRRDWASAGQEAPAAAMTAVGPALGLFGRRAPVAPPNQQIPQLPPAGQFTRRPPPAGRRVAYHGTPHEFESFDSAHIGSGEGAQAFGPGLYVAEEPQVARAYREALSRPGEGRVLEVDIPDGPFIDTDMQFGRLPRQAREAMAEIYGMPESKIPRTASVRVLNAEEASRLRERGYRGIQYLDQGSRGAGKGTRNYVIFNDADLNIRGYERAPRAPSEPVTRLPVNPTRIPTRASDGSVLPAREPQPFRRTEARSDDLRDAARMRPRESDAGSAGNGQRVVYRGMNKPYDPNNGGYYQSFTSSADDAREYGSQVMAARINPGRNLAVDGGGNNFNALSVEQLPADVRAKLHPSVGSSATTDQIAHAAREAGYDSVTVRNVYDNRWGERPVSGQEPRTIDFVFDTRNITPVDGPIPQAQAAADAGKVRLSDADRALLAELEGFPDPPQPDGGSALDASGQGRTGSPTQRLLPAIRDPATGEVFTDARGHAATFERIPMRDENTALSGTSLDDLADGSTNSGFVTPEGQFLTRPQAMEWAAQQEFGGGALQTRYDAARARWLEATNAGRADPALRAELDAAREALNAARRGPQRPAVNQRPDSTLSGSAPRPRDLRPSQYRTRGAPPMPALRGGAHEEARPVARIEQRNGYYALHNPRGGGEFHNTRASAVRSARTQGWQVEPIEGATRAPSAMREALRERIATQRRHDAINIDEARQIREDEGLDFTPNMTGVRDYADLSLQDARAGGDGRILREIFDAELGPYSLEGAARNEPLLSSVGGFPIPPVIRRDFQRLAGGRPSPAPSQRALQGPGGRLTAMSRAGAPEMRAPGSAPSGLLQTPKGASQQSAIDPRVILGGGALGMFPTGAATAALVRQNAEENAVIDRMAALQRENKRRFEELRSRRGPRPYTNPGRLDMNRVVYPFDLEAPNYGYAISPATGRPLPAPK